MARTVYVRSTGLGIEDHREVFIACQCVSAQWKELGIRLGVPKPTLDIIVADHGRSAVDCLSEMLDKWLKRDIIHSGTSPHRAPPPATWKNLCRALSPINRGLAEMLSLEHGCPYVSPAVSEVMSHQSTRTDCIPPAFLPQSCGCGQCTVKGWMTGRVCQNLYPDRRPKLLVVNPDHPEAVDLVRFETSYDRQARLCAETRQIANAFSSVALETWKYFELIVDIYQSVRVSDMTLRLSIWLNKPFPDPSRSLHDLQLLLHSLHVSWFNFGALLFLAKEYLSMIPNVITAWDNYQDVFCRYCRNRSLSNYINVFFQTEDQNIFLIEVDEGLYSFKLSDIEHMRDSLSLALDIPSVCLHLVTVREGCLVVYFYYCYSDYLNVFKSLTEHQLMMISAIKNYRILSLIDLHEQFRYDAIQQIQDVALVLINSSGAEDQVVSLKKQSLMKDVELKQQAGKLQDQKDKLIAKEKELNLCKSTIDTLTRDLKVKGNIDWEAQKETKLLKEQLEVKEREIILCQDEVKELKQALDYKELELLRKKMKIADLTKSREKYYLYELMKEETAHEASSDSCTAEEVKSTAKELQLVDQKPVNIINLRHKPHHLAVCENGDIFVVNQESHSITLLKNDDGTQSATTIIDEEHLHSPFGIAISIDGHLLVTDAHRLQKFTFDGVCVKSLGSNKGGSGQLEFDNPRGIAVHSKTGQIFVADNNNHRIQVFEADLTYSHMISNKQLLCNPRDVALDSDGFLYIPDAAHNYVLKATPAGQHVARFDSPKEYKMLSFEFMPTSVAIHNNQLYVSERLNNRVSVFDTHEGKFLHYFGSAQELNWPWCVRTVLSNNMLYVSDHKNERILVYSL